MSVYGDADIAVILSERNPEALDSAAVRQLMREAWHSGYARGVADGSKGRTPEESMHEHFIRTGHTVSETLEQPWVCHECPARSAVYRLTRRDAKINPRY